MNYFGLYILGFFMAPYNDSHYAQYHFDIINDPKNNLAQSDKKYLIKECTAIAKNSFGNQRITENDVSSHILDGSTTILIREHSNKICGFASASIKPIEDYYIIYLLSIVISNTSKRSGLTYICRCLRIIEGVKQIKSTGHCIDEDKILIGGRTQSPLVYRISNRKIGLFPNPDGYIDSQLKCIGRKLAKNLYDDDRHENPHTNPFIFDQDTFIVKSAYKYTASDEKGEVILYDDGMPVSHDIQIDNYMKTHIDYRNGD